MMIVNIPAPRANTLLNEADSAALCIPFPLFLPFFFLVGLLSPLARGGAISPTCADFVDV